MNPSKSLPQSSPNPYSPLTSPTKHPTSLKSSPSFQLSNDEQYTLVVSQRPKPHPNTKPSRISADLRIVQHNLILATGIMRQLSNQTILKTNCYFARYGQITNMIISSKHSSFSAINQDIQVFVTYQNQLDAAWTIASLKDISHHRSFIKIHYGTSRYCSKYINDEECKLKGCYFNHKYRPEHRHKNQLKELVDEQYERVYRVINDNLEYFVRKEYEDFKNRYRIAKPIKCYCYGDSKDINFPSFKSTFEKLIQQGRVSSKRYEQVKNKIKEQISNKHKGLFTKKENIYKEINRSEHSDRDVNFKKDNQDDNVSVNRSNSSENYRSQVMSSASSSRDSSFEQPSPITDEQQTNRITTLKVTSKLMGRQFRQSRFKFVPYLDLKTILQQQRKLQSIISKQIINNC